MNDIVWKLFAALQTPVYYASSKAVIPWGSLIGFQLAPTKQRKSQSRSIRYN